MKTRLLSKRPKPLEYYKGILIHADTGLHEQAADLFQQYVPPGARVLDVGAGAGAFSQRLADLGYDVTALDMDPVKWVPDKIPFLELDLDRGIAASVATSFDVVVCLEVIEHVENPWSLLRDLYAVVRAGGILVLSTPNITSFLSRLIFLRTGEFHQFSKEDLRYGHINPITSSEITHAATQIGWRIREIRPGGYLPIFDISSLSPKSIITNILRGLTYLIASGQKRGWCLLLVMEKPE